MRIAFYAPLKSPNHPVPSGDRLMARHADGRAAARRARGRNRLGVAQLLGELGSLARMTQADDGRAKPRSPALPRIGRAGRVPDLWFCYHPYSKAPDLIGPRLVEACSGWPM